MTGLRSGGQRRAAAEELAADALGYLAGDLEHLGRFLALSGIGPAELRAAAREPGFLAGVLEFYMGHESLLLAFCEARGRRPTEFAAARYTLDDEGRRLAEDGDA